MAHCDHPGPKFPSESNAGGTLRVEVPVEQFNENENQESGAISEARSRFSLGPLMAREGTQGGFVEASAVGDAIQVDPCGNFSSRQDEVGPEHLQVVSWL